MKQEDIRKMLIHAMELADCDGGTLCFKSGDVLGEEGENCPFSQDVLLALESVVSQAAILIQNMTYIEEIKGLFQSFVKVMSSAIDERTPYNGTHTKHMAEHGGHFIDYLNKKRREMGEAPIFTKAQKEELLMSIWLHDIGKLVTPLEVMNKEARLQPVQHTAILHRLQVIRLLEKICVLEGTVSREQYEETLSLTEEMESLINQINTAGVVEDEMIRWLERLKEQTYLDEDGRRLPWLTEEEYKALSIRKGTLSWEERKIMENHVVITDKLLSQIHFSAGYSHVREWASAHHELLDGTGYPKGLKGNAIPYQVRIITILDIFDALVADDRPYKPGMPIEKALSILKIMAEKEGKLDPLLVKAFIESRCWEDGM